MSTESATGPSKKALGEDPLKSRLDRLKNLQLRKNEARKLNHEELVEEDRRSGLPANHEARKRRAEWQVEDAKGRAEAEKSGEDYDRTQMLDVTAEDAERFHRLKMAKKNTDPGFSSYEASGQRQYERLVKSIKPDFHEYKEQREKLGDEFFPTSNSLIIGTHYPTKDRIDRLVSDVDRQTAKREKWHRRRPFDPEEQIDFINERNARFNRKLERFYGEYTQEIKQNLERGTAV